MTNSEQAAARRKAEARRHKKPILKELNVETIRNTLYDITEAASEIEWMERMSDGGEGIICQLLGDEDDAAELQNYFGMVAGDAEQMLEDLESDFVPDIFDTWFAAMDGGCEYMGYDAYENDYVSLELGIEKAWAKSAANEKLMRMTKAQILDAASACFSIAINYLSIKSRYDDLHESVEILRGKNGGALKAALEIDKLYDQMQADRWDRKAAARFEAMCQELQPEVWVV